MQLVDNLNRGKPGNIQTDLPLIDVIIPFYNAPIQLTREAVESVRAQTYPNWRVTIVNDGSSEQSTQEIEALVGSYGDDKVQYLKTENGGPAAARNVGIRASTGHWITFLDADDYWMPEKLELQAAVFSCRSGVGMVGCEGEEYSPAGQFLGPCHLPQPFNNEIIRSELKRRCIFITSGVMVLREVFERLGGFEEEIIGSEDHELFVRIAASYELAAIHRSLFKKISLPDSLYSKPDVTLRNGRMAVRRARELLGRRSWPGCWLDDWILRQAEAGVFLAAAWQHEGRREKRKAALNLIRALSYRPFLPLRVYKSAYWLCAQLLQGQRGAEG